MVSAALSDWRGSRTARINELFDAHRHVGGTGAGRRRGTEQVNWALILKVAGEFQGFARDLHGETVDHFSSYAGAGNTALVSTLQTYMAGAKMLDRGNANPENLAKDFSRFGVQLWPELRAHRARAARWEDTLRALNKARNAIAHDDQVKFAELAQAGWKLSHLDTVRRFHNASSSVAVAMDTVLGRHLARLFGRGQPW